MAPDEEASVVVGTGFREEPKKKCAYCKREKLLTEFSKNKATADGALCYCKQCSSKISRERRSRPEHLVWQRAYFMKRKYGLTPEGFQKLVDAQGGRCAICKVVATAAKRPGKPRHTAGPAFGLVVDHCHKTGKIRGLLCNRCNRAIGMFEDSPEHLAAALAYLGEESGRGPSRF